MRFRGGPKVKTTMLFYEMDLAVIDNLCRKYNCSRAAVIEAWLDEFINMDLTGKVKPGRRPGGGRKPSKGTD